MEGVDVVFVFDFHEVEHGFQRSELSFDGFGLVVGEVTDVFFQDSGRDVLQLQFREQWGHEVTELPDVCFVGFESFVREVFFVTTVEEEHLQDFMQVQGVCLC